MQRQRYKHDTLDTDKSPDSSIIDRKGFEDSAKQGNLRPDENGNLITSRVTSTVSDGKLCEHQPVLDIDIPHVYVPSRSEGHGHLYLNKTLSYEAYHEILSVLAKHGIVGQGNVLQLEVYGHASARLPRDFEDRKPFYDRNL